MAMAENDVQALERRLERLEWLNRRLHRTLLAVLVLAAAGVALLLYGAYRMTQPRFTSVAAEEFVVVDAAGRPRAWFGWGVTGAAGHNSLQPARFRRAAEPEDGVELVMLDEDGEEQVHLSATPHGGMLELYDQGDARLEAGGHGLTVFAADGTWLDLRGGASSAYIDIHEAGGEVVWQAP
jgi:hypothetical protein